MTSVHAVNAYRDGISMIVAFRVRDRWQTFRLNPDDAQSIADQLTLLLNSQVSR